MIQAAEQKPLDSIDRADLQFVAAATSRDANARLQALETLARVTPSNASLVAELGSAEFARRNFLEAARNYAGGDAAESGRAPYLERTGICTGMDSELEWGPAGDSRIPKLAPEDANALDSLGEVSFFLGDFESATKYFEQASNRNPGELLKAAEARLMTGDLKEADALFTKFAAILPRERAAYQLAQWQFLTGRRAAGIAEMKKLAEEQGGRVAGAGAEPACDLGPGNAGLEVRVLQTPRVLTGSC